jgi:outer membrane immunogenic protein
MHCFRIRLFLAVAIASLALTNASSAADLPARSTYTKAPAMDVPRCTWCGWYVGANGGYAWSGGSGGIRDFTPDFVAVLATGETPSQLGAKHNGGFGGDQVGYNWVMSHWLVGFEADIQVADIGHTSTIRFPGGFDADPTVSTGRDHIDWFGTVRGRLGTTFGSVLIYGTGGLAYGGVHSSATNVFNPTDDGNLAGSSSSTRLGWTAGAGLEWMLAPNWSFKTEYLHVDLGSSNVIVSDPQFPTTFASYRFRHDFDAVRAGVNYHFSGPVVAKY